MLSASILERKTGLLQLHLQYHTCTGMYDITFCNALEIPNFVFTA